MHKKYTIIFYSVGCKFKIYRFNCTFSPSGGTLYI